jgi:plasmid stabilization system protein ParE
VTYSLHIRIEAEQDLSEAYHYYQDCRDGLGDESLLCIEATLATITRQPGLYAAVHRNVHRALIHRSPFGVFYLVENNHIIVVAVMHVRRSPQFLHKRVN